MKILIKMLQLFDGKEKKRFFIMFILIFFTSLIDVLGVASIFPFISVIANPKLIETNTFLIYAYQALSVYLAMTTKKFIFIFGIAVFVFILITFALRTITNYVLSYYGLIKEYKISVSLVQCYLNRSYSWFLNQNSANLSKSILSESTQIFNGAIFPLINIISQGTLVLTIVTLLFVLDPKLAIYTGLFLIIIYVIIFYFVKNMLSRFGSERLKANEERFKIINESFNAIKEVKFSGVEQFYAERFAKAAKTYAKSQNLAQFIITFPRNFMEAIALGAVILLLLILISRDMEFLNIIPLISIYAFAGYRLMPAFQQIYSAFTHLRFAESTIDSLHKELINLKSYEMKTLIIKNHSPNIMLTKSIKLENINLKYFNSKQLALTNINISIPAFSKVGIVGSTGSGKTTLIDIVLGLLDPSQGTLSVDGNVINKKNKHKWQRNIGYVPQKIFLSDNSIAANIAFGIDEKDINYNAVKDAATIANLDKFVINELPNGYNTIIGERGVRLSGGQQQRIGIARALYRKPKLLVLDEATSALDNLTEKSLMQDINNLGNSVTIIIIAHRFTTVKKCDKIFLLEKGKLAAQGSYADLLLNKSFKNMASI